MLYMFQAAPPPIIRRSKLYIQPAAIVEELKLQLFYNSGRQQ
jgi:hypothetical protein